MKPKSRLYSCFLDSLSLCKSGIFLQMLTWSFIKNAQTCPALPPPGLQLRNSQDLFLLQGKREAWILSPKREKNVLSAIQYWDSKQGPPIPWTAPNTSSIALKMKTSGLFCRKRKTGLQTFKPHFRQAPFRGHGNLHK